MEEFSRRDFRIQVIHNQVNLKLPASLNVGFANAKGEYFTWTSDDNYYLKEAFGELLKILLNSNADMVYAGQYIIDDRENIIDELHPVVPETLIYANPVGACFIYKRIIHESLHGYDTNKFLVEDYDFWLRIYLAGFKIIPLDKLLYVYRNHVISLTSTRRKDIRRSVYNLHVNNRGNLNKFSSKYHKHYWYFIIKNMEFGNKNDFLFFLQNIKYIFRIEVILNMIYRIFKIVNLKCKTIIKKSF
jgi:glycosyltransferase involved in cell wall biosynthesis